MTTAQEQNLINLLDGYVEKGGHHLNVNVFNRDTLLDAQAHPEKNPQRTVIVSGDAVNFNKVTNMYIISISIPKVINLAVTNDVISFKISFDSLLNTNILFVK